MLIETFIVLEVLCLITFWAAFKLVTKYPFDVLFWAITISLAGLLAFQSLDVQQQAVVVANQTVSGSSTSYQYSTYVTHDKNLALMTINIGIGLLALILAFLDLFQGIKFKGNAKNEQK